VEGDVAVASALTLLVSVLVLLVSYSQWRTANQKVVIDLYDRRLKVYSQLEAAIGEVMREGQAHASAFQAFATGQADARFLFGDDIKGCLQELRKSFAWMIAFTNQVIDQSPNRAELIDTKYKHLQKIVGFYDVAPALFEPYIRLTQRNTPFWRPW
jgi:hypothetical protein